MADTTNGYVQRKMFMWIMGIIVMGMAGLYGLQLSLNQTFNHSFTEIKIDVAELRIGQEFILEYIREQ